MKPKIVHIQHDSVPGKTRKILLTLLPLLLKLRYKKICVITTIHEFRGHRLRWKLRALMMIVFSDRTIFADRADMDIAMREFPVIPKSRLIHIPIASSIAPGSDVMRESKQEIRQRYGFKKDDLIVFHFGIMHPGKGIDVLIDSFESAALKNEHVKLLLISEMFSDKKPRTGYEEIVLKRIAISPFKDRIITLGSQDDVSLSRYMLASDIAAYPYVMGVTSQRSAFLAALAHGLAVVTTYDKKYSSPTFKDGYNMMMAEIGDKAAFFIKFNMLITDPLLRDAVSREGKVLYEGDFSWQRIAEKTRDIYTEISA